MQPRLALDPWQHQPVHYVLADGRQDGQAESGDQQHEEPGEVLDAHLQSLGQNGKGTAVTAVLHLVPHLVVLRRIILFPGPEGCGRLCLPVRGPGQD